MSIVDWNSKLLIVVLLLFHSCVFSQEIKDSVCVTRTGTKYHRCTCHYLKASRFEMTMEDVIERGYTACSVCRPPLPDENQKPVSSPPKSNTGNGLGSKSGKEKPVDDGRCTAITNSGSRCKRSASAGTTRCWQHQE